MKPESRSCLERISGKLEEIAAGVDENIGSALVDCAELIDFILDREDKEQCTTTTKTIF